MTEAILIRLLGILIAAHEQQAAALRQLRDEIAGDPHFDHTTPSTDRWPDLEYDDDWTPPDD